MVENKAQVIYSYHWLVRWSNILFNILAFVMPIYYAGKFTYRAIAFNVLSPFVLIVIFLAAVIICMGLVITANFFSDVNADQFGLYVSFLWYRLPVAWQDIIEIKEIKPFLFNLSKRPTMWVVSTRALTPFHRLYGLLYAFNFYPSFTFHFAIENCEDLINKIKQRRFDASAGEK